MPDPQVPSPTQPPAQVPVLPSGMPLPPNTMVTESRSTTMSDLSGITGVGAAADQARLISQFGIPAVTYGTFLTLFIGVVWWVLTDFQTRQREVTDAHEREIKEILVTHKELHAQEREDNRDREKTTRDSQKAVWGQLRDITTATQENNKTLQKATEIMSSSNEILIKNLHELRKMTKGME